jgi:hypothetical protein
MVDGCPTKEKDEPYGPRLNMGTQATLLCVVLNFLGIMIAIENGQVSKSE